MVMLSKIVAKACRCLCHVLIVYLCSLKHITWWLHPISVFTPHSTLHHQRCFQVLLLTLNSNPVFTSRLSLCLTIWSGARRAPMRVNPWPTQTLEPGLAKRMQWNQVWAPWNRWVCFLLFFWLLRLCFLCRWYSETHLLMMLWRVLQLLGFFSSDSTKVKSFDSHSHFFARMLHLVNTLWWLYEFQLVNQTVG